MTTAACRKCGGQFEPTSHQIRKRDRICLPCRRSNDRAWRARRKASGRPVVSTVMPLEYHRSYNAAYYARQEIREKANERARMRRQDPVENVKARARCAVKHAIEAGKLQKRPCFCGETRVDAHHDDYSRPLDVVWLCRTHHIELHHPKSEGAR